jgi:hypothetical protein
MGRPAPGVVLASTKSWVTGPSPVMTRGQMAPPIHASDRKMTTAGFPHWILSHWGLSHWVLAARRSTP